MKIKYYSTINFLLTAFFIINYNYKKVYAKNETKTFAETGKGVQKNNIMNYNTELDKMNIQIPTPSPLKDVIILDAGHGYMDSGGGYNDYYEYIPNAQIIFSLANELAETGFFEVYITHPLNYAENSLVFNSKLNPNHKFIHILLPEIEPEKNAKSKIGSTNYSRKYGVNLLYFLIQKVLKKLRMSRSKIFVLSIHHNKYISEKTGDADGIATGMEVFYTHKKYGEESKKFGNNILNFCKNLYGISTTHKTKATISNYRITNVDCPAVLCEVDFLSNLNRQKIIKNSIHQIRMVRGLKNAILHTYGYETLWGKMKFEKNIEKREIKISVSNLPEKIDNLKFAILDATKKEILWIKGFKKDKDWICTTKIEKENDFFVDIYSKINGKETFIETDFNTPEIK